MWIVALGLGVLLAAAIVVGLVLLAVFVGKRLGGSQGGWGRLAAAHPASVGPVGPVASRQTIQIGGVIYRRCVTMAPTDEGLFVSVWGKRALVPWREITAVGQATLFWQKVPMLTVGNPAVATLTIPTDMWPSIQQRLPAPIL